MKSLKSLQCIFMLFILCIVRLGCCAPQDNDEVTTSNPPDDQSKSIETYSAAEMCSSYSEFIYKYIKNSTLSDDKDILIKCKDCHNNAISNTPEVVPNVNDERTAPREFLHVALLGDSNGIWLYSGSLISNRWILSVAHFEGIFDNLASVAVHFKLRTPITRSCTRK
ncbi:serine protease-like precursor [Acyrthosiphon pisum]|uniref:ACYPI005034 protein n=1 Tax=Acyrthosiphon pisum TaxID=7029 RepID=C4WXP6_ACYPI|nr:serine protease-like precursor [Acyrthosiphon pisum]BAH72666.1 ACYPI005034 [Acyrthosiphon pisum]|eukprot:NP_001155606.1 serine protease-like precursor [Acyrthosiphon pisum]